MFINKDKREGGGGGVGGESSYRQLAHAGKYHDESTKCRGSEQEIQ